MTDGTVQYGTVWYSPVQYGLVRYGTVQYSTVWYGTVHHIPEVFKGFQGLWSVQFENFKNTLNKTGLLLK